MHRVLLLSLATPLAVSVVATTAAAQQRTLGSVATQDAIVTGTSAPLETTNGRLVLTGNGTVTAKDHTAPVTLTRGGEIQVCSTSGLHMTAGSGPGTAPLMLSLDRGAMEIHMDAGLNDIVMTPDLRMSVQKSGPLDLRIRVTSNGDTCVENRVAGAADKTGTETGLTVNVSSLFGSETYDVKPGQHVLFEHASLSEVVDHESSSCGCPPPPPKEEIAGGVLGPGADPHPFPEAVSQGLAPEPPVPQAPEGEVHAQVSTTLSYNGNAPATPPGAEPGLPLSAYQRPAPPPPPRPGFLHRVGHFLKRLF
jgi:hypothetical protein